MAIQKGAGQRSWTKELDKGAGQRSWMRKGRNLPSVIAYEGTASLREKIGVTGEIATESDVYSKSLSYQDGQLFEGEE